MISLIAATDKNGLIGMGDKLPWNVPSELKYFQDTTKGSVVIFGRKTYQGLPKKPLKDRINIVLSSVDISIRREQGQADPYICESLSEVFNFCRVRFPQKHIFICGGRSLYAQTIDFADRAYISLIEGEYDGDVYFPGCPGNPLPYLKSKGFEATSWNYRDSNWSSYILERFPCI
jgi:dihydrofolate reductase